MSRVSGSQEERIAELEQALAAKNVEIERLRFKLFGQFCADRGVKGCSHSTACSIWGDDGQGGTKENFPQPLPCNCGALENWRKNQGLIAENFLRQRAEAAEAALREKEVALRDGIGLIAAERQRQISVEGWTPEHDDEHSDASLSAAARCYADDLVWNLGLYRSQPHPGWPWQESWWKPSDDPIRNLVKAGALIAAEIERLQRVAVRESGKEPA